MLESQNALYICSLCELSSDGHGDRGDAKVTGKLNSEAKILELDATVIANAP
jgi:hypothetical protein